MLTRKEWQKFNYEFDWQSDFDAMSEKELIKEFPLYSYGEEKRSFLKQNYIWLVLKEDYGLTEITLRKLFQHELDKWKECKPPRSVCLEQAVICLANYRRQNDEHL